MKKKSKAQILKDEEDYIKFLTKRIDSKNYKNNVTAEEYEKTKTKYEKAKFKLRILKDE